MPQKLEEVSRQKRTGEKINKSVFLTYLLQQKSLTPEEVNGHVVDLLMGAVETVSRVLVVLVSCPSHHVLPLAGTLIYPLCGSDEVFGVHG